MQSEGNLAPTQARERIASLDVIRGVAVLGILLINITEFGMPLPAYADPTVYGGAEGINLWTWVFTAVFFQGTQRGLFTLLFGAGVILFTERMEGSQRPDATDLYFRRNLWLMAFGIVHGFLLLWIGEILFAYGVIALFVYAFRKAAPATLIWIALGGLAINAAWSQIDLTTASRAHDKWREALVVKQAGGELSREQRAAVSAWEAIVNSKKPDTGELQRVINVSRGSYIDQVLFQAPIRSGVQSLLVYRYFFDMFSLMLIGMALFRSGLLHVGRSPGIYWRMIVIGYGVGITAHLLEVRYLIASDFGVLAQAQTRVWIDVGRLAITAGHVGTLMLFCNAQILSGVKRRLAAVGRMAFTNYIGQSIFCAFVFFGVGFGLFGQLQRYQLYYVVAGIWIFQLIFSPVWLKFYRYGPLEWVWRSLTYGKQQPMRRGSSAGTVPAPST